MTAKIMIRRMAGAPFEETKLISFRFVKDAYTPYTSVSAQIFAEEENYMSISEILLYVGEKTVHHGLVDSLEAVETDGKKLVTLTSRGFTSLLCQNQTEPGMKTGISFNGLMDGFYALPYVTHEDNDDTSGYIYVKNNSTMWDGVVGLAYRQSGMYPYIRGTNCVRITAEENPAVFSYEDAELTASGLSYSYKRMVSNFHMADINGDYGTYELEDSIVTNRNIVRHKYFELDKQFLYNPKRLRNTAISTQNAGISAISAVTAAITERICAML